MYECRKECHWKNWSAKPGDMVKDGDVPPAVIAALKVSGALVVKTAPKLQAVPETELKS